ncbi:hypothetical protein HUT16_23615 [Kitasatospora sp. NA04385]|uniref:hypothetical protein n=1 Tax=Kitasatospora sp. NA04385 TaxID=2742135 RepID=UPI0015917A2B|nr:hypothetical protein [Kitasatospora sp. NA04385]QKW21649.1 hypothetical protein HUT16_23615 [Kitasatospora sp. NA04385]
MYEYELFKVRERELHSRAAAERLAREAVRASRSGLVERVVRAVRREAAPVAQAKSGAEQGRSGAVAGCAG